MKSNAENDKNALKVIMFTIACSDKMAQDTCWEDLRQVIIEELDNVLELGTGIAKDVIIAINVNNNEKKIPTTGVEKLN